LSVSRETEDFSADAFVSRGKTLEVYAVWDNLNGKPLKKWASPSALGKPVARGDNGQGTILPASLFAPEVPA
jgi:hypothetical protein